MALSKLFHGLKTLLGAEDEPVPAAVREAGESIPTLYVPLGSEIGEEQISLPPEQLQALRQITAVVEEVPPLPPMVGQLRKVLSDPDATAEQVAQVISADPALTAAVLRAANSSMHGLKRKIVAVEEAVRYLGFATVQNLMLQLKVNEVLRPADNGPLYSSRDVWLHSLMVADVANYIARRCPGANPGLAATLGLMHDIGKIAMNALFPAVARTQGRAAGASLIELERKLYQTDHTAIGALLTKRWTLPEELISGVWLHHTWEGQEVEQLDDELRKTMDVLRVANQVSKYCCVYCDGARIDPVPNELLESLGLPTPLPALLDEKLRDVVSRAIFYADATPGASGPALKRMLWLHRGQEAEAMVAGPSVEAAPHLVFERMPWPDEADPVSPALRTFQAENVYFDQIKLEDLEAAGTLILDAPPEPSSVQWLAGVSNAYMQARKWPAAAIMPGRFVLARMLETISEWSGRGRLRIWLGWKGERCVVAVEAEAMAFEKRLPQSYADPSKVRTLLTTELASVFNLNWFEQAVVSPDGQRIVLITPPAE